MSDPKSARRGVAAASTSAKPIGLRARRGRIKRDVRILIDMIQCHVKSGMTSIMASIGTTLMRARTRGSLTQTELARRAGISRQALGAIESGAYHPGVAIAIRIARELGTSVEALFGEIDDEASTLVEADWSGDARSRPALAQPRVVVMLARVRGKVVAVARPAAHL